MLLSEQSIKVGHWLFRWRGYLPLFFLLIIIPAFQGFHYPCHSRKYFMIAWGSCIALSMLGVILRAYTVGFAAKGTSGRNTKEGQVAETLNTTGIYSVVRNPLYLGNFIIMLGQILLLQSAWCVLVYMLCFWLYYERIIMAEEDFLRKKFGVLYEQFANATPVFLPKFSLWKRSALPYSTTFMIRKECHGLFVMMLIYIGMGMVGDYIVTGTFEFALFWGLMTAVTTVVYLVTSVVSKKLMT